MEGRRSEKTSRVLSANRRYTLMNAGRRWMAQIISRQFMKGNAGKRLFYAGFRISALMIRNGGDGVRAASLNRS